MQPRRDQPGTGTSPDSAVAELHPVGCGASPLQLLSRPLTLDYDWGMSFFREPYPEDILNRVAHDYPAEEQPKVLEILSGVRDQSTWIQLAALRGANGNVGRIQLYVDLGNADWRDLHRALNAIAGPDWERDFILYSARRR